MDSESAQGTANSAILDAPETESGSEAQLPDLPKFRSGIGKESKMAFAAVVTILKNLLSRA